MTLTLDPVPVPETSLSLSPADMAVAISTFRREHPEIFGDLKRLDAATATYYGLNGGPFPAAHDLIYRVDSHRLGLVGSISRDDNKFKARILSTYGPVGDIGEPLGGTPVDGLWLLTECVYLNPDPVSGASYVTLDGRYFTFFGFDDTGFREDANHEVTFFSPNSSGGMEVSGVGTTLHVKSVGYFEVSTPISASESGLARYRAFRKEQMLTFAPADEDGNIVTVKPEDIQPNEHYLVWGGVMGETVQLIRTDSAVKVNGYASVKRAFRPASESASDATAVRAHSRNYSMSHAFFENIDGISAHNFSPVKTRPFVLPRIADDESTISNIKNRILSLESERVKWSDAMNELAEDNEWCSEYEGTVVPLGFEGRQKGDYEISARVNFSVEYDYGDSPSGLDSAISDYVIGGNDINRMTVTIEVSTTVNVTVEDAESEDDARERSYELVMESVGNSAVSSEDIEIIEIQKQ